MSIVFGQAGFSALIKTCLEKHAEAVIGEVDKIC